MTTTTKAHRPKPKGFAAIKLKNPDFVSRIATMGGKALATARGKKYMKRIGKQGGIASGEAKRERIQNKRLQKLEGRILSATR